MEDSRVVVVAGDGDVTLFSRRVNGTRAELGGWTTYITLRWMMDGRRGVVFILSRDSNRY